MDHSRLGDFVSASGGEGSVVISRYWRWTQYVELPFFGVVMMLSVCCHRFCHEQMLSRSTLLFSIVFGV